MPTPVTRKQVAERAGVSEATVSYVINDGPRPVAVDTRQRILQAIDELGYYPSDVARSLRMKRTQSIGLIVPDTANPFYGEVARALETTLHEQGYTVILCNSNFDLRYELNYANVLRTKRVEGTAIIPVTSNSEAVARLVASNIQTVVLDHEANDAHSIVIDEFHGGVLATQHLIDLGHRRIGLLTHANETRLHPTRRQGYEATLRACGLPLDPELVIEILPGIEFAEQAALNLLQRPQRPTAIFANDDITALATMSAARKLGLSVPRDLSVIGFDDIVQAAYFNPPLTTIASPKKRMGEEAANLPLRLINDESARERQRMTLDVRLVQRESTATPAL